MDNVLLFQKFQRLKDLDGEAADQRERHAHEVVSFDELVQVDAEQFEAQQQVRAECAVVLDADDVVLVLRVLFLQVQHDVQFYLSLMLEFLLVSDDFDCDGLARLVVQTL